MPTNDPAGVAIVIVTYRRPDLLRRLLLSISQLRSKPGRVVIVDNASGDSTSEVLDYGKQVLSGIQLNVLELSENRGGSGGFSAGVRFAYDSGSEWLWLIDDDVEILPGGLSDMLSFGDRYLCLMGRREDANGKHFFFQNFFVPQLGIHLPHPGNVFNNNDVWHTNLATFEGLFIHRSIVRNIGAPDPRFFVVWDDLIYGWLASKITDVVVVDRVVIRKTRVQRQINLGVRHLNDSSDISRYYTMRNRGLVANYLLAFGELRPFLFGVGSVLTLLKELARLFLVERSVKGISMLSKGTRDARLIRKQAGWEVAAPLEPDVRDKRKPSS